MQILFISSFSTYSAKFSEFDAVNVILFQIKVFGRNTKGTRLARHFIKVTARPSFARLRVIRRINRIHKIPKEKICYKDSVVYLSYLNLLVLRQFLKIWVDVSIVFYNLILSYMFSKSNWNYFHIVFKLRQQINEKQIQSNP